MKTYIVSLTAPEPLIGFWRWEGEAQGPDFARAIALRETGAPRRCTSTVRPAPPATTYRQDFLDSERARLLDRMEPAHG